MMLTSVRPPSIPLPGCAPRVGATRPPHSDQGVTTTLLETDFPYLEVSQLVAADRRATDPAYQAHRWFARRPPALIRAALLAAGPWEIQSTPCATPLQADTEP